MGLERRGRVVLAGLAVNHFGWEELGERAEAEVVEISKWAVWEAYRRVKANRGGAGVDEQSMRSLRLTLDNCTSSGTDVVGNVFPLLVRAVRIPKRDGSLER